MMNIKTPLNQRTVTVKMSRHDLAETCLAIGAVANSVTNVGGDGSCWYNLLEKLKSQLQEFDEKYFKEDKQ